MNYKNLVEYSFFLINHGNSLIKCSKRRDEITFCLVIEVLSHTYNFWNCFYLIKHVINSFEQYNFEWSHAGESGGTYVITWKKTGHLRTRKYLNIEAWFRWLWFTLVAKTWKSQPLQQAKPEQKRGKAMSASLFFRDLPSFYISTLCLSLSTRN